MHGTEPGFLAWATLRGYQSVIGSTVELRTQALVRASDYIDYRYINNFCAGYTVDNVTVIEQAAYIIAKIEVETPGFFSTTYTPAEQKVLTEVKGIKWTVVGKGDSDRAFSPVASMVESMFAPYLCLPDPGKVPFWLRSIGE